MNSTEKNIRNSLLLYLECQKAELPFGCAQFVHQAIGIPCDFTDVVNGHEKYQSDIWGFVRKLFQNDYDIMNLTLADEILKDRNRFREYIEQPKAVAREVYDQSLGAPIASLIHIIRPSFTTGHIMAVINPETLSRQSRKILKKAHVYFMIDSQTDGLYTFIKPESLRENLEAEIKKGNYIGMMNVFKPRK